MNSNEIIKSRLKKEIEDVVPDVLPSVMEKINNERNTSVISIETYKKRKTPLRNIISIAAALILIVTGVFSFMLNPANTIDVEFDVNPGIILEVNKDYKVVDVTTLNEDAVYVIGSMDLKVSNLNVAINALMYSIIKNGYIDEMTNSVLVSVGGTDEAQKHNLTNSITNEINTAFAENSIEGSVLVQSMETSSDVKEMAKKYNITEGKASLIKHLVTSGKTAYTYDSLANLSINELNLILSAKEATDNVTVYGHASTKAYIGDTVAKNIAYNAAGVDPLSVKHSSCEIDLEDGIIVYDVEFIAPGAIYECEIDALTGEICDIEVEPVDDLYKEEICTNIESNPTVVFKSKEEIKQMLLEMNNISPADCQHFSIKLEYDDSIASYEVEFVSGNVEYEYKINAVDGSILSYSHENSDDYTEPSVTVSTTTSANTDVETTTTITEPVTEPSEQITTSAVKRIGKEEAVKTALNHAGVSDKENIKTETEFGFNNGVVYNIEFEYNGYEYEYEINALTGEIVDFEKERDD